MRKLFALNFRSGLLIGFAVAIAVAAAAIAFDRYDTQTLKRTVRRDAVLCGVNTGLPGFSSADEKGNWSGFDVDFCRAIAAAIFDDPNKVKFVPLDASESFTELQKRNVESGLELDAAKVRVQSNTTSELNLADYFRANNMKYREMKFAKMDDVFKAYDGGQCEVLTTDASRLYALRLKLSRPSDHVILPDVISKEPLAPVVRQKDDDWFLIVKWTFHAMVNAEELGITSRNIDEALKSKKPDVMRFVGTEGAYGEELGLTKDWAVRIIRHVGNYGEVYERNVGADSELGIPRGLNELWNAR